jgi:uncharacterized protein YpuA (DUF1002 family)
MNNQLIKMVVTQTLVEYGIRMTSDELKMLVDEKMNYKIPQNRWNQVVEEISEVSGMIDSQ